MKHVTTFLFMVIALSIGLVTRVDANSIANMTLNSAIEVPNAGYMDLYVRYLLDNPELSDPDNYLHYTLVYIDDDDIPELVLQGTCEASGFCVLSQYQGVVSHIVTARLGFSYIEKSGLCCNSNMAMGYVFSFVFQLKNGKFSEIARWESEEDLFSDEEEIPITFSFNGEQMSEDEANALLKEVYSSKGSPINVFDCKWQDIDQLFKK